MKKTILLLIAAGTLICSCKMEEPINTNDSSNQNNMRVDSMRLIIQLPNYAAYYSFSADPNKLNSGGDNFFDILVSKTEMRKLAENLSDSTIFRWEDMTAQSPYPKNECVLLAYGGLSEVNNLDYMCSIGDKNSAVKIIQELAKDLTGDPNKAFIDIQNIILKSE